MSEPNRSPQPTTRLGKAMIYVMWLLVLGLLALLFNNLLERQLNPNRLVSSYIGTDGAREVVLQRNRGGHYVASGFINNQPVVFLLDTGASDISVPADLARRLKLERGPAVTYMTAKGEAMAYRTRLDRVTLGEISLENVRASINPNVRGGEVLLGMTFLKHLEFAQRGDRMILRQYP